MRRRYLVEGAVQGVGFRYFAWRQGKRLGIAGWVRNLPDGRVEAVAEGAPELLGRFAAELRRGPMLASVTSVQEEEISDHSEPLNAFEIR